MVNHNFFKFVSHKFENKLNDMLNGSIDTTSLKELDLPRTFGIFQADNCQITRDVAVDQGFEADESSEYQILPTKYFKYSDIPPPLVSTVWLKKLDEDNEKDNCKTTVLSSSAYEADSEEDSIPLCNLIHKLSAKNSSSLEDSDSSTIHNNMFGNKNSDNTLNIYKAQITPIENLSSSSSLLIHRKRGRPRKSTQPVDDCFNNCSTDCSDVRGLFNDQVNDTLDWWKDSDSIAQNDFKLKNELLTEECDIDCNEENDFSNSIQEDSRIQTREWKRKKNKNKDHEFQSLKLENSKLIFPCTECNKTFSAASTLRYHMRIHNGTLIKCNVCDKGFTTNYLLKCHMRLHNGDLFMCHKCGRGFITAELLKVHSRSHTGVRPYTCQLCGKSFPSASNLTQHKETHEPEKKYLCSLCGSSFSQRRCLDAHMVSHGEKNHICNVCGKLWARKSDLTEHMRVHTGSKPYACNNCPQKFSQASSLRRHQMLHKKADPVQCVTCGKMLKCNEYYKRHIKKHVNDKVLQMSVNL